LVEQHVMETIPHAGALPIPQAPPAGHATAAAQFLRQQFPGDAALQHEEDAGQGGAIRKTGAAAFRLGWFSR